MIGLSTNILWIVYLLAVVAWIAGSAVLSFHWRSYAQGDRKTKRATLVYYIGSVTLLIIAASILASL